MDFIFDPSLVLYLPLYELDGASFMSADAYGHLCTISGALWTPRGRSFDGSDDKISCGTPSALNFGAGSFTIEGWVHYTAVATDKPIFGSTDSSNRRRISLRSNAFSRNNNAPELQEVTFTAVTANIWHHLVGVYDADGGKMKVYLDGEFEKQGDASGTLDPATENWIGANPHPVWWLPGLVGEVRLYNRALNPPEIQHNYLATKRRYR